MACRFIENDKLDAGNITKQRCFSLTNHPGDACIGPVIGEISNNGQSVARVADRGKTNETNVLRFGLGKQLRKIDNKGRAR